MIYDKIDNINKYYGISQWFDMAIDFLKNTDLDSLPLGRTDIYHDKVFANIMDAQTKEEDEIEFEIHKKYRDIQIDIEGTEIVQIGLEQIKELDSYKEDIDFGTVLCEKKINCVIERGWFIVCMQEEPHKPGITVRNNKYLKKCVIKVAID